MYIIYPLCFTPFGDCDLEDNLHDDINLMIIRQMTRLDANFLGDWMKFVREECGCWIVYTMWEAKYCMGLV